MDRLAEQVKAGIDKTGRGAFDEKQIWYRV
jgi:hypothetical protein